MIITFLLRFLPLRLKRKHEGFIEYSLIENLLGRQFAADRYDFLFLGMNFLCSYNHVSYLFTDILFFDLKGIYFVRTSWLLLSSDV